MDRCIEIIDEIEADKKGTNDEKHLNMTEKYKYALLYLDMLDNLNKYSHLDQITNETQSNQTKVSSGLIEVRLKNKDLKDHLEM